MSQIFLHSLPKITTRPKKRVGRGYGSGKGGHTSGRGQKGQKSRRTIPWSFEGGALPLSRRLPFWRGKGRLNPLRPKPIPINLEQLEKLKAGSVVDAKLLVAQRLVAEDELEKRGVKILGRGKLTKNLTIVGLPVSLPAKNKIEKAGGNIVASVGEVFKPIEKKTKIVKTVKTEKVINKANPSTRRSLGRGLLRSSTPRSLRLEEVGTERRLFPHPEGWSLGVVERAKKTIDRPERVAKRINAKPRVISKITP